MIIDLSDSPSKFKFSGIYSIINTVNNKRYIGSSNKIYRRIFQHRTDLENGMHHSGHLQKSFNKYGIQNFKVEILEIVCDLSIIEERERFYVNLFQSTMWEFGYNLTSGGAGCPDRKLSSETKRKIGESNKGKKMSPESRIRISIAGKGRKHTEETKKKMSESRKGVPQNWNHGNISEEGRRKISETHLGRKRLDETKDRITESKTGVKIRKTSSSKYVGVSFDKGTKKWQAYINVNKKRVHLGRYKTENEAASVYNLAALENFGINAKINYIEEE